MAVAHNLEAIVYIIIIAISLILITGCSVLAVYLNKLLIGSAKKEDNKGLKEVWIMLIVLIDIMMIFYTFLIYYKTLEGAIIMMHSLGAKLTKVIGILMCIISIVCGVYKGGKTYHDYAVQDKWTQVEAYLCGSNVHTITDDETDRNEYYYTGNYRAYVDKEELIVEDGNADSTYKLPEKTIIYVNPKDSQDYHIKLRSYAWLFEVLHQLPLLVFGFTLFITGKILTK